MYFKFEKKIWYWWGVEVDGLIIVFIIDEWIFLIFIICILKCLKIWINKKLRKLILKFKLKIKWK